MTTADLRRILHDTATDHLHGRTTMHAYFATRIPRWATWVPLGRTIATRRIRRDLTTKLTSTGYEAPTIHGITIIGVDGIVIATGCYDTRDQLEAATR